jgi:hypothetical protein
MSRYEYYGTTPSTSFENLPASVREMSYYDLAQLRGRQFHNVHAEESHGGNAGYDIADGKRWIAAGINGFASLESGRFAAFGNFQFLEKDIVEDPRLENVTVRLGTRYCRDDAGFHYERHILDLIVPGEAAFTPQAKDAMLGAVMLYNEQQYLHSPQPPA